MTLPGLALTAFAAAALAGCAGDSVEVSPSGNMTMAEARDFAAFPLYFLGESVGGLNLEAIQRTRYTSPRPHTRITFFYGTCEARGDAGCSAPLRVLVWPECYRFDQRYSIAHPDRIEARGVPGRVRRDRGGTPKRVELYPAGATVVVDTISDPEGRSALELMRLLRGVNVPAGRSADLPELPPRAARASGCNRG